MNIDFILVGIVRIYPKTAGMCPPVTKNRRGLKIRSFYNIVNTVLRKNISHFSLTILLLKIPLFRTIYYIIRLFPCHLM